MDWFLYDNGLRHERVKEPSIRKERNQAQNENDFSKLLLNPFQI